MNNPKVQAMLTPPDYRPVKLEELVNGGHLGVKAGKGFMITQAGVRLNCVKSVTRKCLECLRPIKQWKEANGIDA